MNTRNCGKEHIEGFTGSPQNRLEALVNFILIAPAQYGKDIGLLFVSLLIIIIIKIGIEIGIIIVSSL